MYRRPIFAHIALIFLMMLASCGDNQSSCEYNLVISQMSFDNGIYDETTEVQNVNWSGECLDISFTYSGGCDEHAFQIVSSGEVIYTNPPIITLGILHDNQDECDAIITETIGLDILGFPGIENIDPVLIKFKDDPDFTFLLEF